MRSLRKNQQRLQYATYSDQITIYERDKDGNIIYVDIDGEQIPSIAGEIAGYNEPVIFFANIAMSGGESESKEYGVNSTDYEAVIFTTDKSLPIDELSLIWHTTEPVLDTDGLADADSADYKVIAVKPSLNGMKYLLKKLPKGGGSHGEKNQLQPVGGVNPGGTEGDSELPAGFDPEM